MKSNLYCQAFLLILFSLLMIINGGCGAKSHVEGDGGLDLESDTISPYSVHEWGVVVNGEVLSSPRIIDEGIDKPIIYFYAEQDIDNVEVSVTFNNGVARESWPEIELGERLVWSNLRIEAEPCGQDYTPFPGPGEGQCGELECEVTTLSNYIVDNASCIVFGEVRSPLLFYSGILNQMEQPIEGDFSRSRCIFPCTPGIATLTNNTDKTITDIFVVFRYIGEEEHWISIGIIDKLEPGETDSIGLPETIFVESPQDMVSEIEEAKNLWRQLLQRSGLTDKEVSAFMKAWERFMFGLDWYEEEPFSAHPHPSVPSGPSLFIYYILPRDIYDQILPISIEPLPKEIVRVGAVFYQLAVLEGDEE